MTAKHLYLVPRAEQDDDDFMEAVVEVGAEIPPPPPPARNNVVSFTAYAENLPAWVPFNEIAGPKWTR